jgi:hypothetical protein
MKDAVANALYDGGINEMQAFQQLTGINFIFYFGVSPKHRSAIL